MHLLILGATGLLGSNVVHEARRRNWDVSGTYHTTDPCLPITWRQFDFEAYREFEGLLGSVEPDAVVNCAGVTDVDACERNPSRAHRINAEAPIHIAEQCHTADVNFVSISTDYVFDGATSAFYSETDEPNPLQVYGQSKLNTEAGIQDVSDRFLLPRVSFLWGINRNLSELEGFPAWVGRQAQRGTEVTLYSDQRVTPTRAGSAAQWTLDLLENGRRGLFHLACSTCITPYEFGQVVVSRLEKADQSVLRADHRGAELADRPRHTCLDVSKLEESLEISARSLRTELDRIPQFQ